MDSYQCEDCKQCFEVSSDEYPDYYDEFYDGEFVRIHFHRCPHCGSALRLSW